MPLGRSPFSRAAPTIAVAVAYAIAAVVWATAGSSLPGGRWLAVHLFTLGVLTNLVLVFSDHFGRTVTRSADEAVRSLLVVANAGIPLVLFGVATSNRWAVGAGATVLVGVVFWSYWRLRRMRRAAVGARFAWIARMYERAHGAFIHGAVLGLLMGIGLLPGPWHGAARIAHLHVNVLGWVGLTVLATLVFFGPTMVRTRILEGADQRSASALRHGATAVTVGVLLLLATGIGDELGLILRLASAAALAVFAWSVTVTCTPVASAARRARPSATRWPVVALSVWFPLTAWADVVVIATGAWSFMDSVGVAMFLGVLAQTVSAVLTYIAPMLRGRGFAGRDRLISRFERGAVVRVVAYNVGVMALVASTVPVVGGIAGLTRAGWILIVLALAYLLAVAVIPVQSHTEDTPPVSRVARRYCGASNT